jgi:hypothetical protein
VRPEALIEPFGVRPEPLMELLLLMLLHKRLKNVCGITLMITQQAGTEIVMK